MHGSARGAAQRKAAGSHSESSGSAPVLTRTSVLPVNSVAQRANTVAGYTHWSPLTVVTPSRSACGVRNSISNDRKFVPCGPALPWSAMT